MYNFDWLQTFAEGSAPASNAGEGAGNTGVTSPADAGQDSSTNTLEALGVPKNKVARYEASLKRRGIQSKAQAAPPPAATPAASTDPNEKTESVGASAKTSWEDILKDPEYKEAFNNQVNGIMQKRLAKAQEREANVAKLAPALEVLAAKYGVDVGDYEAIARAVNDDDDFYREKAAEMGVDVKTAKELTQSSRELHRLTAEKQDSVRQQYVREHIARLNQQAENLKAEYPGFNLSEEMQNEMFVKLTAPGMLTVEDAYKAVHRKEIEASKERALQEQALAAATATIRAGQQRPKENGSSAAATITRVPPAMRSKAERAELRRQIYAAGVNGKKLPRDW